MLARLAEDLPEGSGWLYEPKWDGFRAIAEVGEAGVAIHSRNGHRLDAVFPDVAVAIAEAFPCGCVVDGELVSRLAGGGISFEGLLRRLGGRHDRPATLVPFDLLALDGTEVTHLPLVERRRLLENSVSPHALVELTVQTDDLEEARAWLADSDLPGVEGVVAKRAGDPYRPGARRWVKVKRRRTVDCVVGGFRGGRLLLGLYDGAGLLHHVGETVTLPPAVWAAALPVLATEGSAFTGRPPGLGRWEASRYTSGRSACPPPCAR